MTAGSRAGARLLVSRPITCYDGGLFYSRVRVTTAGRARNYRLGYHDICEGPTDTDRDPPRLG
jgi:hypothetical protein